MTAMMKMSCITTVFFILIPALASAATTAPAKVECPLEISQASIQVTNAPGWKPFIQFPLRLSSAGMSAGPPESLAVLHGEPLNKKGQPQATRYEFGEMGFDQGKWLDCGYGAESQVTLSKRLNDQLKECTITYLNQELSDKPSIKITCK